MSAAVASSGVSVETAQVSRNPRGAVAGPVRVKAGVGRGSRTAVSVGPSGGGSGTSSASANVCTRSATVGALAAPYSVVRGRLSGFLTTAVRHAWRAAASTSGVSVSATVRRCPVVVRSRPAALASSR